MDKTMIKVTPTDTYDMISFHGNTITTTLNKLNEVLGEDADLGLSGDEKCQHDFLVEITIGDEDYTCDVYDWKEYRDFGADEEIEWHIGAKNREESEICYDAIMALMA